VLVDGISVEVDEWTAQFDDLFARIAGRFGRLESRRCARDYIRGLLGPVKRKNSWQLAEYSGHRTPHRFQHLLGRAEWEPDQVRDDVRGNVFEHLGQDDGVLIFDETGFIKKGEASAGVARQYTGTSGKIADRVQQWVADDFDGAADVGGLVRSDVVEDGAVVLGLAAELFDGECEWFSYFTDFRTALSGGVLWWPVRLGRPVGGPASGNVGEWAEVCGARVA
jgi:hypothetical protein